MPSEPRAATPVAPAFSYGSARALVEALHQSNAAARADLRLWLLEPIRKLMAELSQRHNLNHNLDRLVRHSLHAAETYLRTRPIQQFASLSLPALRSALLLQVAKQAIQPFGGLRSPIPNGVHGPVHTPEPLPLHDVYHSRTYFLPYEKIGSFWFGGDWYGGHQTEDGSLWVIVADITGHGYYAYLLANTLPSVWQACWRAPELAQRQPSDVLGVMHDLLAQCLPDGVYVECTLIRLEPQGQVTIAPAGGSRLFVRHKLDNQVSLLRLRGLWLGLDRPLREDQHLCTLAEGDELVIGSDGVFDQLIEFQGAGNNLTELITAHLGQGTLLEAVASALQAALVSFPQKDDITVVAVHRKSASLP